MLQELEQMPPAERGKLWRGLNTVGFVVEEAKNKFFANTFDYVAKSQLERKSPVSRFFEKLSDTFRDDAKRARENIENIKTSGRKRTLVNTGYLFGNILKYGRTVADIVGWTVGSPLRYVMMGTMAFSRSAGAVKEVRLENEKVIEQTRIEDADKAAEEAWRIYEEAKKEGGGKVEREDLEKAYQEQLPEDLLNRFKNKSKENPGLASRFIQKIARFEIESSVSRLEKKLAEIEGNVKLSNEKKELERQIIFSRYERRLRDWDRMVGQYGTIDSLAMGSRYVEIAGKVAVAAVTVETLYLGIDRLWHVSAKLLTESNLSEAVEKTDSSIDLRSLFEKQMDSAAVKTALDSLMNSGVSKDTAISSLLQGGVEPDSLLRAGVSVDSLLEAGAMPDSLLKAGVTPDSLINAGVPADTVTQAKVEVAADTLKQMAKLKPSYLNDLFEKHPQFKGDSTWKVGGSGLITREGYSGSYFLNDKGDLFYSGGKTADGRLVEPQVLRAGSAEWQPSDEFLSPGTEEMIKEAASKAEAVESEKILSQLKEKFPFLADDNTFKVDSKGVITREGYTGTYRLDEKTGDLIYSGGKGPSGAEIPPRVLTAGSTVEGWIEAKPETGITPEQLELATIKRGEGVTHAIVRQLKVDPEKFGYDPKSGMSVDRWAILKSRDIAIENGYIRPDGSEVRVLHLGEGKNTAYILETDASGKFKVTEYLEGKPSGGGGKLSPYEYEWKPPKVMTAEEVTERAAHPEKLPVKGPGRLFKKYKQQDLSWRAER